MKKSSMEFLNVQETLGISSKEFKLINRKYHKYLYFYLTGEFKPKIEEKTSIETQILERINVYVPDLCSSWLLEVDDEGKVFTILRPVNKQTFYNMYSVHYNPIQITIEKDYKNLKYWCCSICLYSIDDTSYNVYLPKLTLKDAKNIKKAFVDYVDSNPIIDGNDLVKFGLSLGGIDNSD